MHFFLSAITSLQDPVKSMLWHYKMSAEWQISIQKENNNYDDEGPEDL